MNAGLIINMVFSIENLKGVRKIISKKITRIFYKSWFWASVSKESD